MFQSSRTRFLNRIAMWALHLEGPTQHTAPAPTTCIKVDGCTLDWRRISLSTQYCKVLSTISDDCCYREFTHFEIMQLNRLIQQYKHERECNAIIGQTREDKIVSLESLMDGILPTEEFTEDELLSLTHEHEGLLWGFLMLKRGTS